MERGLRRNRSEYDPNLQRTKVSHNKVAAKKQHNELPNRGKDYTI